MSPPLRDGVIYAGVPVNSSTFDRFNYMVLLRILKCGQGVLCSGALISHKGGEPFVITAKHCIDGSQGVFEIYACTQKGYWNGVPLELYTNETEKNAVMYLEGMTESPNAADLLVTRRDLTLIPLKNKKSSDLRINRADLDRGHTIKPKSDNSRVWLGSNNRWHADHVATKVHEQSRFSVL